MCKTVRTYLYTEMNGLGVPRHPTPVMFAGGKAEADKRTGGQRSRATSSEAAPINRRLRPNLMRSPH